MIGKCSVVEGFITISDSFELRSRARVLDQPVKES